MRLTAKAVSVENILPWRDLYRQEMNCQIIHDSLHDRPGWTKEYLLQVNDSVAGYGSIAVGGPWKGKPTACEFYLLPQYRSRAFDLFETLLAESAAVGIEVQSNDPLITVMLHTFAENTESESILFHDRLATMHSPAGVTFRRATPEDAARFLPHQEGAGFLVEAEGVIAGTGGILFHYNRPYGDIYMEVAEQFRRRGFGSYLVQELKRVCYEGGNVPGARCNQKNIASRKTLQKAGFVPCGQILSGYLSSRSE
ncbi:MAG: GNAT family N-acetyltransferase [Pirellulales bacterium]